MMIKLSCFPLHLVCIRCVFINKKEQAKWIQNYTGLAMANPALNHSERQKNVANMLATLRIEKLGPNESLKPSLQAYEDAFIRITSNADLTCVDALRNRASKG